jgi:acyl-coenzyme A thioesterase PaaI-like protein
MSKLPGGKRLFSLFVGRFARYSGSIGAQVVEFQPGHAILTMRDRPKVRNHLRSVHAIALMNLGELSSGLATMACVESRGRGIVTSLHMDYEKKARGVITGTGSAQVPDGPGKVEVEATSILTDASGDVVARCRAIWKLDLTH